MKHLKKMAFLLLPAVFWAALPAGNALKVSAATPTTHLIIVDTEAEKPEDRTWTYRIGGNTMETSRDTGYQQIEYYLNRDFKNGDILIIQGQCDQQLSLNLGNRRISNLTIAPETNMVPVIAGSIDVCYVTTASVASITGSVTNAYVYEDAKVTFCSDVAYLELVGFGRVGCQGTVGHVKARNLEVYNVAKGMLNVDRGYLNTDAQFYSTTPPALAFAAAPAPIPVPVPAPAPAPVLQNNPYDQVPQTGETLPIPLLLTGIAFLCLAGRAALLKKP